MGDGMNLAEEAHRDRRRTAARRSLEGASMLFPWYEATMLSVESAHVIALRFLTIAAGGKRARNESELMIREKVEALIECGESFCTGATLAMVIARYREHVAANALRLAA